MSRVKKLKYENDPDLCILCGKPLSWKQHKEKGMFCSSSCAAKYNNKMRGSHSAETRQKQRDSLINYLERSGKRKQYNCIVCGKQYYLGNGNSTKK